MALRQNRAGSIVSMIALAIGWIGCGSRSDLASVRGKVTLDGQPLPGAFIVFAPTTKGTSSRGKTDSVGSYEMMFTDQEKGAWIGENLVRINTGDVGPGGVWSKESVPAAYNKNTTLKVEVKPGGNVFDFDLKSNAGKIESTPTE